MAGRNGTAPRATRRRVVKATVEPSLIGLEETAREYGRALVGIITAPNAVITGASFSGQASMDLVAGSVMPIGGILPPPDEEIQYRLADLDNRTLDKIDPRTLLYILIALDPVISAGLYYFLRLCNPGSNISISPVAGEGDAPPGAQAALDAFFERLSVKYGAVEVVINKVFFAGWARGAMVSELVFANDNRTPIDLATPDPGTMAYRAVPDEDQPGHSRWQLVQVQAGVVVPLDRVTISYVPVDPAPGSPYGRSLSSPALYPALFMLGLLHNLRRVMAQQGMPRIDIEVDEDVMKAGMPAGLDEDPVKWRTWVNGVMTMIGTAYQQTPVDGAYLHVKGITVNKQPVGTADSNSTGGIASLIEFLERELARALKLMPILLGIKDAASEADANRQWEIQAAGIKALQHLAENMLSRQLTMALQAQGFQVKVTVRFAELRSAEELRDAQAMMQKLRNALILLILGWENNDTLAQEIVGHAPTGDMPPADVDLLAALVGAKLGASVAEPGPVAEPAANRSATEHALTALLAEMMAHDREAFTPKGSDTLPAEPKSVTYAPDDIDALVAAFKRAVPARYRSLIEAKVEATK